MSTPQTWFDFMSEPPFNVVDVRTKKGKKMTDEPTPPTATPMHIVCAECGEDLVNLVTRWAHKPGDHDHAPVPIQKVETP